MTKDQGLIEDKSAEKPKTGFTVLEAAAIAQTALDDPKPKLAVTRALRRAFLLGQGYKYPAPNEVIPADADVAMIEITAAKDKNVTVDPLHELAIERAMHQKLKVQFADLENRMRAKDGLVTSLQHARSAATERINSVIDQREDAYKMIHSILSDRLADVEHDDG